MRSDIVLSDGQFGDGNAVGNHAAGAIKHVPAVRAAAGDVCDAMREFHDAQGNGEVRAKSRALPRQIARTAPVLALYIGRVVERAGFQAQTTAADTAVQFVAQVFQCHDPLVDILAK